MNRKKDHDSYVKFLAVIDTIINNSDENNPITIKEIQNLIIQKVLILKQIIELLKSSQKTIIISTTIQLLDPVKQEEIITSTIKTDKRANLALL